MAFFLLIFNLINIANELEKIRNEYLNPGTSKNMNKVNEKLNQVQDIMRENISDIISRGTQLSSYVIYPCTNYYYQTKKPKKTNTNKS